MKRKQVALDKIDSIDNTLVAAYQALSVPNIQKDAIERYLTQIRMVLSDLDNLIKLED